MQCGNANAFIMFIWMSCLATGCNWTSSKVDVSTPVRPAVEVDTTASQSNKIIDFREFTGRTAAVQSVEVRVQVNGYLVQSPQPTPIEGDLETKPLSTSKPAQYAPPETVEKLAMHPFALPFEKAIG